MFQMHFIVLQNLKSATVVDAQEFDFCLVVVVGTVTTRLLADGIVASVMAVSRCLEDIYLVHRALQPHIRGDCSSTPPPGGLLVNLRHPTARLGVLTVTLGDSVAFGSAGCVDDR